MKRCTKNDNKAVTRLLKDIKRGDKNQMDELFSKTYNHFLGYALVRMWDKSKAEDAVMSMYESVLKYIGTFDDGKDGMGWMFTILKRIVYNYNAEEKQLKANELSVPDNDSIDAAAVLDMYEAIGLSDMVAELDETDRNLIYLHYFECMTYNEISEFSDLSVSATHRHMKHAIKKLEKFLH